MISKKSILIVDDQESIIDALKICLSSDKYNILSANNGHEALELIANRKDEEDIFLIICDKRMPQMTGLEMLEAAMELLPDAIRVIMSAYTDIESIIPALNRGVAHRFIIKPWSRDELEIIVHYALEYPEKFRNVEASDRIVESYDINIMQKDIKRFNEYRNDMALGHIAFHHGFITQRQLEASMSALHSVRKTGRNVSLENILFEKGLISSEDMGKLIAASRRKVGKSFGLIAVNDYGVQPEDIKRCLAIQAKEFKETSICRRIGEILVAEQIITEEQKDSIIIDMTYLEKEEISKADGDAPIVNNSNKPDSIENKIILNKKKQIFFRQRAIDKLFCKIAINKNFVTETEVVQVFEEQLAHFSKNFEIRKIRDIFIDHYILSAAQADLISNLIASKPDLAEDHNRKGREKIITIGENGAFELTVSADEMEAKIRLVGKMPNGINADNLKYLLKAHQIIYGLADDIDIELFLRRSSAKNKKEFIIAKGRPVKLGRDASIKYFFEDENSRFGRELASGKFDYRDHGEIDNVKKGDILAQKIPFIPAVKGSRVTGIEIPAPIPIDVNLSCGKGALLSKDGLTVIADVNGRPDLSLGGKVSVMNEKTVEGNVDFKTGNIVFGGDVNVDGTILPGFSVTADNLTVNDIDEGLISVENNIIVKNNIINAVIKSGGNLLVAQSMKKSNVSARGDVVIEKEIMDCNIITSGKVLISRGRIVSSTIHAAKGIEAKDIGSRTSSPCKLFPGADDHANDTINQFNEQIDSEKKRLEDVEAAKKDCEQKIFEQLNTLSDMSKIQESLLAEKENALSGKTETSNDIVKKHIEERIVELDKNISKIDKTVNNLFSAYETSQNRAKLLEKNIKDINALIHKIIKERNEFHKWYEKQKQGLLKKNIPSVTINNTLFAGTQIRTNHCSMQAKEDIKSSRIYEALNNTNPEITFYEIRTDAINSKRR